MTPVLRELKEVSKKLDKIDDDNAKIMRGLYGDEANKQPGLIQRHIDLEARLNGELQQMRTDVNKVRGFHRKIAAWGTGVLLGVEAGWHGIKELFK